jgi:ABC-type antimicrobial peptide transport system permease subunit
LGATPGRIRRDVQVEGLVLIALGLAAGVVLSFALRRSLNAFLYGVGAADPLIWTMGIAVLLAAGAVAGAIPAARAARVDPSTMLRDE